MVSRRSFSAENLVGRVAHLHTLAILLLLAAALGLRIAIRGALFLAHPRSTPLCDPRMLRRSARALLCCVAGLGYTLAFKYSTYNRRSERSVKKTVRDEIRTDRSQRLVLRPL